MRYEAQYKLIRGFHQEAFDARTDDEARRKARDIADRKKSEGEGFVYLLALKKQVRKQ